jgi:hypothetical protein
LQEKSPEYFRKTEHVMPQSFGRFKNNFTLNGIVCDDCNKHFGDNLETDLARDTFEGLHRYEFDVKKPEEFKSVGKRSRITRTVAEGAFKGSYTGLVYCEEQGKIVLKPVPQIGFRKKDSDEYEFFLLDDVPDIGTLKQRDFDLDHPRGIMMLDQNRSRSEAILLGRGFPSVKIRGEIEPPEDNQEWLCKVEGTIDDTIRRAIAKISFNYLACWEGREFMLHADFDITRGFIRYGEKPAYPLMLIENKNILRDELRDKIRVVHIVTVEYAADGKSILSQVSIFNFTTYKVCLSREFSGPRKDIKRGHLFNLYNREIWPLGAG